MAQTLSPKRKALFIKLEIMHNVYEPLLKMEESSLELTQALVMSLPHNNFEEQSEKSRMVNFVRAANVLKEREFNFDLTRERLPWDQQRALILKQKKGAYDLIEDEFYNVNFSRIISLTQDCSFIDSREKAILISTLNYAIYARDFADRMDLSGAPIKIFTGSETFSLGNSSIYDPALEEGFIPGNCGLDCFSISREAFVNIALDYAEKEKERNLYGYAEILSAVKEGLYVLPDTAPQSLRDAIDDFSPYEEERNLITSELFTDYVMNFYMLDRISLLKGTMDKKGWLSHVPNSDSSSVIANPKTLGMMELLADHFRKNLLIFSSDHLALPYTVQHAYLRCKRPTETLCFLYGDNHYRRIAMPDDRLNQIVSPLLKEYRAIKRKRKGVRKRGEYENRGSEVQDLRPTQIKKNND